MNTLQVSENIFTHTDMHNLCTSSDKVFMFLLFDEQNSKINEIWRWKYGIMKNTTLYKIL